MCRELLDIYFEYYSIPSIRAGGNMRIKIICESMVHLINPLNARTVCTLFDVLKRLQKFTSLFC